MGFTAGQDNGSYDESLMAKSDGEAYHGGSDYVEKADFTGTLDTSGVAPGASGDLRNVTRTFDEANANLAERLANAGIDSEQALTPDEREAQRNDPEVPIIEGQGERTDGEVLDALKERQEAEHETADGSTDPSGDIGSPDTLQGSEPLVADPEANPALGEPGEGQEENAEKVEEAQSAADAKAEADYAAQREQVAEAADSEALSDAQVASGETGVLDDDVVLEKSVTEVKDYAKTHPEQIEALLAAEKKGQERSSLISWLDDHKPYDPSSHNVGDTKSHFESADDDEVARVKAIEASGQNRPGIMNWTRA